MSLTATWVFSRTCSATQMLPIPPFASIRINRRSDPMTAPASRPMLARQVTCPEVLGKRRKLTAEAQGSKSDRGRYVLAIPLALAMLAAKCSNALPRGTHQAADHFPRELFMKSMGILVVGLPLVAGCVLGDS